MSGQLRQSYGLVLRSPERSRELDLILMSPFKLEIFSDSMNIVYATASALW